MENEGRGLLSRCCIVSVQGAHLACHRWAPDHGNISERQHTTENRGGGHLPRHLRRLAALLHLLVDAVAIGQGLARVPTRRHTPARPGVDDENPKQHFWTTRRPTSR